MPAKRSSIDALGPSAMGFLGLCLVITACDAWPLSEEPEATRVVAAHEQPIARARPPKPGERVRQRELDSYCAEAERPIAFYYHGGRPVERLARNDGCYPLFLEDCTEPGKPCHAQGDQEPGMWCCHDPSATQQASR